MKRAIYVVGYLFSAIIGFLGGVIVGLLLIRLGYQLWSKTVFSIFSAEVWVALMHLGAFIGGMYFSWRFTIAHNRLYSLLNMKRYHQMTFYEVRHLFGVSNNVLRDIFWAYGYTLLDSVIPVVMWYVVTGLVTSILFPFLWYFAVLPGLVVGIACFCFASNVVTMLFWPKNLEQELNQSGLIMNIFAVEEREKKQSSRKRPRGRRY